MSRKRITQLLAVTAVLAVFAMPQSGVLAGQIIDHANITYVYNSGAPSAVDHTDSTGDELCDGVLAPGSGGFDSAYVGYQNTGDDDGTPQPQITFDLGDAVSLESIDVFFGIYTAAGIDAPDSMSVALSTDGTTFGTETSFTGFDDSDAVPVVLRQFTADMSDLEARYVRVNVYNDAEWTFLSEIQFTETTNVPEPSTAILLVGIAVFLLGFVRRRKNQ